VRREVAVWRRVMADPRTPRASRWLLAVAVGYAVLPFDLIPDVVPGLGYLDDVLIIALLVAWAVRRVPPEVIADARRDTAP